MDSDAMETEIEVAVEPATLFLKSYHLGKSKDDDFKGRRFLL
jgi:hypothetical protein